jgi:signal transduction histidine kinase
MAEPSEQHLPFEVDASVVFQLGESLISDEVQALLELIKNAYDADATSVDVSIEGVGEAADPTSQPRIRVSDNGCGMTEDDIRRGWLNISASLKRDLKRKGGVTSGGRTPLGDKGLGRLSTQRLGDDLEIVTRPKGLGTEYEVSFRWSAFGKVKHVGDVRATVRTRPAQRSAGTTLTINGLSSPQYWATRDARDYVEKELSQLLSPYGDVQKFAVGVTINGEALNLLRIPEGVRKASQLHFGLEFRDTTLVVTGGLRLAFFEPAARSSAEDRSEYATFIAADEGLGLRDAILSRSQSADWQIRPGDREPWYLSFAFERALDDVRPQLLGGNVANPGPFRGEVDAFEVEAAADELGDAFSTSVDLRRYMRDISGIRVYRDGFGIRVDDDWLNLRRQWSGGRSWYSLRPDNTFGYIAIGAKDNAVLEEKTDREGFRVNPYYVNFHAILVDFVSQSGRLLNLLGRTKVDYIRQRRQTTAPETIGKSPEEIATEIGGRLASAAGHERSLEAASLRLSVDVIEAEAISPEVPSGELTTAIERLAEGVRGAQGALDEARRYLAEVSSASELMSLLRHQIEDLRDQMEKMYEMVGLGLTAEVLSHEILQVTDQLTHRTSRIRDAVGRDGDKHVLSYIAYVDSAMAALRKQLAYLAPSLRYVRERRDDIELADFLANFAEFHRERLAPTGINLSLNTATGTVLRVNQGKLTQIFDNLLLNSEYWLREQGRLRPGEDRTITIEAQGPIVRYSDSGPGIPASVEGSLFEAFVTTKGRAKGRGLGLYIVRQFLAAEGCSIALDPVRNAAGRLYQFRLDLSGMVKAQSSES